MNNYIIKPKQNGLDVVNQLFGSQDYISELYLNNIDFNINKMQEGLNIQYEKIDNQIVNTIETNGYIFVNEDNIVYEYIAEFTLNVGYYSLSNLSDYYDKAYLEVDGETIWITESNNKINIYKDNTLVVIKVEIFD